MRILLYLKLRQFVNYIIVTARTPKRLIPALIMILYFVGVFVPQIFVMRGASGHGHRMGVQLPEIVPTLVFLLFAAVLIHQVHKAFSEGMLVFGPSDVDFLFPMPIDPRKILALKLATIYVKLGLYVAFFTFIFLLQLGMVMGAQAGLVVRAWLGVIFFMAFVVNIRTFINLISTFRDGTKWWAPLVVRAVANGFVIVTLGSIAYLWWATGSLSGAAVHVLSHPVYTIMLLPARWAADQVACVLGAANPVAGRELLAMGLLTLITFVLVMLRNENPYEPSLAISARAAAVRAAMREGGLARVRTLAWNRRVRKSNVRSVVPPFGRGAIAIVWKNLNITARTSGTAAVTGALIIAGLLIASKIAYPHAVPPIAVEGVASAILGYVTFIIAIYALQLFRGELKMANILKPMPIPSWQIVMAQAAHGAVLIGGLAGVIAIMVGLTYGLSLRGPLLLVAIAAPFVAYSAFCWQSTIAILYPRWDDPTQQFVGGLLATFSGMISVIPAGVVVGLLYAFRFGSLLAALGVAAVSVAMSAGGIAASGYLYSRFDPTDE